jgi:hypothetical protein
MTRISGLTDMVIMITKYDRMPKSNINARLMTISLVFLMCDKWEKCKLCVSHVCESGRLCGSHVCQVGECKFTF